MLLEVRDSSYLSLLSTFGPGKAGLSVKGMFGEEKKMRFSGSARCFFAVANLGTPRRRCESSC